MWLLLFACLYIGIQKLSSVSKAVKGPNYHYADVEMGSYGLPKFHSKFTTEPQYEECGAGVISSNVAIEENPAYQSVDVAVAKPWTVQLKLYRNSNCVATQINAAMWTSCVCEQVCFVLVFPHRWLCVCVCHYDEQWSQKSNKCIYSCDQVCLCMCVCVCVRLHLFYFLLFHTITFTLQCTQFSLHVITALHTCTILYDVEVLWHWAVIHHYIMCCELVHCLIHAWWTEAVYTHVTQH